METFERTAPSLSADAIFSWLGLSFRPKEGIGIQFSQSLAFLLEIAINEEQYYALHMSFPHQDFWHSVAFEYDAIRM